MSVGDADLKVSSDRVIHVLYVRFDRRIRHLYPSASSLASSLLTPHRPHLPFPVAFPLRLLVRPLLFSLFNCPHPRLASVQPIAPPSSPRRHFFLPALGHRHSPRLPRLLPHPFASPFPFLLVLRRLWTL